jgi:hypothetical protein
MAMSVVEAMQLGLIPVVKPVGEIGRYAVDQENSIFIRDGKKALIDIIDLIRDVKRFTSVSEAAFSTWTSAEVYSESVLSGCSALVPSPKN